MKDGLRPKSGFLPTTVRRKLHNKQGEKIKLPSEGPNFFCFIGPKTTVNKSMAIKNLADSNSHREVNEGNNISIDT